MDTRTINTLEKAGILTIGDLAGRTRDDLLSVANFGETTIRECSDILDGLSVPHANWKPPRSGRKGKKKKKK